MVRRKNNFQGLFNIFETFNYQFHENNRIFCQCNQTTNKLIKSSYMKQILLMLPQLLSITIFATILIIWISLKSYLISLIGPECGEYENIQQEYYKYLHKIILYSTFNYSINTLILHDLYPFKLSYLPNSSINIAATASPQSISSLLIATNAYFIHLTANDNHEDAVHPKLFSSSEIKQYEMFTINNNKNIQQKKNYYDTKAIQTGAGSHTASGYSEYILFVLLFINNLLQNFLKKLMTKSIIIFIKINKRIS